MDFTQNLSQVAAHIDIKGIGRTKIYFILRELRIVDHTNKPEEFYMDRQVLAMGKTVYSSKGFARHVTLAVGNRGIEFIRRSIISYLKDHPIPRIEKRSKG